MSRSSNYTLNSFYTIAEQKRAKNKQKLRDLAAAKTEAEQSKPPSSTRRQKYGYFVNRTMDITTYLCMKSRLSQAAFNKISIAFILLAVYLRVFSAVLTWAVDSLHHDTIRSCEMAILRTRPDAPQIEPVPDYTPVYELIMSTVQDQVDTIPQRVLDSANATVETKVRMAKQYTWALCNGYNAMTSATFDVAFDAAQNSTKRITSFVNSRISQATKSTHKKLDGLQDSLENLTKSLNSDLFDNASLSDKANISLDAFKFAIPQDLNANLTTYHNRPDFGFNRINNQVVFALDSINLLTEFDKVNVTEHVGKPPQLPSALLNQQPLTNYTAACPIQQVIDDQFSTAKQEIQRVYTGVMVACIVLGSLAVLVTGTWDWYHWRRVTDQAKALETLGGFQDAVQNMDRAEHPVKNWFGEAVGYWFCFQSERSSTLSTWTINYAFSDRLVNVLIVGATLVLAFIFQTISMSPITSMDTQELQISAVTLPPPPLQFANSTSLQTWGDGVNQFIKQVEDLRNKQLDEYHETANKLIKAAMVDSSASLRQRMEVQIKAYDLPSIDVPEIEFASHVPLSLPRIDTDLLAPAATAHNTSRPVVNALKPANTTIQSKLTDTLNYFALMHLQVGLGLVIAWMLVLIIVVIYALCKL